VSNGSPSYRTRGCQTLVQDGMMLSELTPELRFWLKDKLK
jgi:hypothetical protein